MCVLFSGIAWSTGVSVTLTNPGEAALGPERVAVLGSAYALSLLLCVRRSSLWSKLLRRQWLYLIFLVYILASSAWSLFPRKVLMDWGHFVGHSLVAAAAAFYLVEQPRRLAPVIAVCCAVIIAVSIPVSIAMPGMGTDPMTGRWQGITGNSNTLGLMCALALWAGLSVWYLYPFARMRMLFVGISLVALAALHGSGSATSIAASIFLAIAIPILNGLSKVSTAGRTWRLAVMALAAAFIL